MLGAHMHRARLRAMKYPVLEQRAVAELWVARRSIRASPARAPTPAERLLGKGVLSKETHDTVVRLAPPLVIVTREDLPIACARPASRNACEVARKTATCRHERSPRRARSMGDARMATDRQSHAFLMCRPEHFGVIYSINPWMDPRGGRAKATPADRSSHPNGRRLHFFALCSNSAPRSISSRRRSASPTWSLPRTRPSCSTVRCCWRASVIPHAQAAEAHFAKRLSAACRRMAWSTA